MSENMRNHFRLEYPKQEAPKLRLDKNDYTVVDLSEMGIKFENGPRFRPSPNSQIKGTVVFSNGTTCEIQGKVLRLILDKGHCVVMLTKGVPYAKMLEEQRNLLKKYQK